MQIATSSLDAVPAAIQDWQPTAVVTVLSPRYSAPLLCWTGPRLVLTFKNIKAPPPPVRPSRFPMQRSMALPRADHVRSFLRFIEGYADGRVLIHCTADLGRPPALAIVALVAAGRAPHEACALVHAAVSAAGVPSLGRDV